MKSLTITQDQKAKLLIAASAVLGTQFTWYAGSKVKEEGRKPIHWFEFICSEELIRPLFNNDESFEDCVTTATEDYLLRSILFKEEHPVDLIFEQYKKESYKKKPVLEEPHTFEFAKPGQTSDERMNPTKETGWVPIGGSELIEFRPTANYSVYRYVRTKTIRTIVRHKDHATFIVGGLIKAYGGVFVITSITQVLNHDVYVIHFTRKPVDTNNWPQSDSVLAHNAQKFN